MTRQTCLETQPGRSANRRTCAVHWRWELRAGHETGTRHYSGGDVERAGSGFRGIRRPGGPAQGSGPQLALHARIRRDPAALRLRAVLRTHARGVQAGSDGGAALLGDAGAAERARRPQPRGEPGDRARDRHGDLRRRRILDDSDHQGRLRRLRAPEAQAPDRARLACKLSVDDRRARREG